ncbi:MAG TPA: hypothetical protein VLM89_10780 [Phycisphaerae bacterium]|nr:hypothetical protein [Phycisphaerae bacterium]
MPGRPKKRALQATAAEQAAADLLLAFLRIAPPAIAAGQLPANASPWLQAWHRLAGCVGAVVAAAEELGCLCRQAAGITEPGPIARLVGDDPPGETGAVGADPTESDGTHERP